MHISGKIFVWLAVIAWIAALPLITKLTKIRSSWQSQVAELREQNAQKEATLVDLRPEVVQLENEVAATERGWGRVWDGVPLANVDAQTGVLEIDLGMDHGLEAQMTVHAFAPHPDQQNHPGEYTYLGLFEVPQPNDQTATIQPLWLVRTGHAPGESEVDGWGLVPGPQGTPLRIRERVPTRAQIAFNESHKTLAYNDVKYDDLTRELAMAEANLKQQEAQLSTRMNELVGVPGGAEGLLQKLTAAEVARNAEAAEVDRLRRAIKAAHEKQESLKQQVAELEQRLPGATE